MARVPVGAYVPGDSFFHKAHPFVKFYWVFSFVIFCFFNKNPYINYALTALALVFVFTGPKELTCLVNLDLRFAALFL